MPKYYVTIEEVVSYEVIVDAKDEDDAKFKAEDIFVNAPHVTRFQIHVDDREISNVEC